MLYGNIEHKTGVYYLEFLVYNFGQNTSLGISFLKWLKGIFICLFFSQYPSQVSF